MTASTQSFSILNTDRLPELTIYSVAITDMVQTVLLRGWVNSVPQWRIPYLAGNLITYSVMIRVWVAKGIGRGRSWRAWRLYFSEICCC